MQASTQSSKASALPYMELNKLLSCKHSATHNIMFVMRQTCILAHYYVVCMHRVMCAHVHVCVYVCACMRVEILCIKVHVCMYDTCA